MSTVRMCDNCRSVFSEIDEGWTNMTGNRSVRNPETGKMEMKNQSVDWCADCTEVLTGQGGRPQIAQTGHPRHAITREQIQASDG